MKVVSEEKANFFRSPRRRLFEPQLQPRCKTSHKHNWYLANEFGAETSCPKKGHMRNEVWEMETMFIMFSHPCASILSSTTSSYLSP